MFSQFPGYTVSEIIHNSVNAIVYRGRRTADGRPVILKTLPTPSPSSAEIARYQQEFELTQALHTAGVTDIAQIYGLEMTADQAVLILEDNDFVSLAKFLREQKLTLDQFFPIAIKITRTLGRIHQQHIIHKDINPANILIHPETRDIKLIDFGLASQLSQEMTEMGGINKLEGTLPYLAPEQTGRMNRPLDYRADFYALGATFYELLVGEPPFIESDPLTLVSAHLTQLPTPPHLRQAGVPYMLSELVLKLLAKDAADRYQSAYGLQADLVDCWSQWQEKKRISHFPLGRHDVSDQFRLPQKLYGREDATQEAWRAFEEASAGGRELLLVTGEAGVGKTALVRELYKPLTQRRGFLMTGSFNLLQRSTPYVPLAQGLRQLLRQLLTESAEQLAAWREKIRQLVGPNGQVLIELLPELQHILGRQPAPAPLPAEEARHRFNQILQNLILLFAHPQHPLIVVVDDMQWADIASLEMVERLLTHGRGHLLLIGLYRHEEVNETHPLTRTLGKLEEAGVSRHQIHLRPLVASDIEAYVADTVGRGDAPARALAQLVNRKTAGNPFFMGEFLKELHKGQALQFNHLSGRWEWDLGLAEQQGRTDNVVALMAHKVSRLAPEVQALFKLAACIGTEFDLHMLAKLTQAPPSQTAQRLWPALQEELVVPLDATYHLAELDERGELPVRYRFAHDRVQEAAYKMLAEPDRTAAHWQIGQLLWQSDYLQQEPSHGLFVVVNQLNLSWEHARTTADRRTLAQLNLQAAQKTKLSAAFQAAYEYAQMGVRLLPEGCWQTDYALARDLHTEVVQCAYLCHQQEEMWQWSEKTLPHLPTLLEQLPIYEIQIQTLTSQQKFVEGLQLGRKLLAELDVDVLQDPSEAEIEAMLAAVAELWQGQEIANLLSLPPMTNPSVLAAMRLLVRSQPVASVVAPNVQTVIILHMVRLSLLYGNTPSSCLAYVTYGNLLVLRQGNIEIGYQFGLLALAILRQFEAQEFAARVHFVFNGLIRIWKEPLTNSLEPLLANYHHGRETGDYIYSFGSIILYAIHALSIGKKLTTVEQVVRIYKQEAQRIQGLYLNMLYPAYLQGIRMLLGQTAAPTSLSGDDFDEEQTLAHLASLNNNLGRAVIFMFKLMAAYHVGEYEQAQAFANQIRPFKHLFWGTYWYIQFTFYDSLAHAALLADDTPADSPPADLILQTIAENQQKMAEWASHNPPNFLPQWHLVQAEYLRRTGSTTQARQHYDQAIELAQQYENRHVEALALEKAAEFHLWRGQTRLSAYYLSDAYYLYERWGARLKVTYLQQEHPQLILKQERQAGFGTIRTSLSSTSHSSSQSKVSSALDLLAIIQATQAIAGEVVEESLYMRLMQVVLEGMPIQRGLLLLPHTADQWHIGVEGYKNPQNKADLRLNLPLIAASAPLMLIHYVIRTHESLVLNDLIQDDPRLADDPYIAQKRVRAAVCLPLVNRGELRGVLYLENSLAAHVFSDNHIALLHILASQAAVALDNAQLYHNLEQRVAERTAELQQLVSELDAFSHTVAHDLKSPLSGVIGYAEILMQEIEHLSTHESKEMATRLVQSGQRMRHIIDGLLTLATTRAGDVPLNVLNMKVIVLDQKERLAYALAEREAQLHLVADQWPRVVGYEAWVGEVWANYISNAIKYGGDPPLIELGTDFVENNQARFWVRDNGPGLTAEQQAKLFTPFTQLGERRADSHGLGLSIAQRIIERLGGRVGVESEVGEGSLFYFTLPLA